MTVPHEIRVAHTACLIARRLGLTEQHTDAVRLAALMHDVGKIVIPHHVLAKPGPLTPDEYALVKTHSIIGERLIGALQLPVQADWIRHHHERFDGHGYPDGLLSDAIPRESRIIFTADVFDALTSTRPYRLPMSNAEALVEIHLHSGDQFDPECVDALEAIT